MNRLRAWVAVRWPAWRRYWTQRGVVPRWQYLLVYVMIVGAGLFGFSQTRAQSGQTQQLASRTNTALCALRHDLQDRVAAGERFLAEHPHGIPGIPAGTFRTSIAGQRRTIEALSLLRCP